jgi:hypothetical protein
MRASGAHVVDASSVPEILRQAHLHTEGMLGSGAGRLRCSWDDVAVCSLHCPVGSPSAVPQSARVRRPTRHHHSARRCARRAALAAVGCANTPACRNVHQWGEKGAPPHLQPPRLALGVPVRHAVRPFRYRCSCASLARSACAHPQAIRTPIAVRPVRHPQRPIPLGAESTSVWRRASQRVAPWAALGLARPLGAPARSSRLRLAG